MKIILNTATHGDERIGVKVAEKIKKLGISKDVLIVQIANKRALDLNTRYIDQDLNRSFPGKKNGNYEQSLAYKLSPIIKSADVVIDIHSTTSGLKDALIVTKLDTQTLECVKAIQPKHLLIMNATKRNALISQAKIGIGFEYGKDKDPITVRETTLGIKRLLKHLGLINIRLPQRKITTNYFNVTSTIKKPRDYSLVKGIKNYQLISKGSVYATNGKKTLIAKEDFYPILFGEKKYKDIFGFSAQKINIDIGRRI